jgi:hypothetical protein
MLLMRVYDSGDRPTADEARRFGNGLAAAVICAVIVFRVGTAWGYSGGIASSGFPIPSLGCNFCHSGGSTPTVTLTGPTAVAPNSTNEYVLTVLEIGMQDHAGLNVSSVLGSLSTGGVFSTNTRLITEAIGGRDEITHSSPKQAIGGMIEFSFLWTAPGSFTNTTLTAWGNAVDNGLGTSGDNASSASLEIFQAAADTPTPTPIPSTETPTETPGACGNGGIDLDEQCDDGASNGTASSCCDALCQFKANGNASCDGNVCTRSDTCTDGVCTPGSCADSAPCTFCGGTCVDTGSSCECQ